MKKYILLMIITVILAVTAVTIAVYRRKVACAIYIVEHTAQQQQEQVRPLHRHGQNPAEIPHGRTASVVEHPQG